MYGTDYFVFSILIGGIIAAVRFSKIQREYYPFIFVVWLACVNEILGFALVLTETGNYITNNIYSLVEALLLLWFFRNMGTFRRIRHMQYILSGVLTAVWITDNFIIHRLTSDYNSYFNIVSSFTLVLLAITTINNLLVSEKKVLRNSAFLICCAIVIFYTYLIVIENFWIYGLDSSRAFLSNVYSIMAWINLFCNLLYALAILWMRKKQEFSLQF